MPATFARVDCCRCLPLALPSNSSCPDHQLAGTETCTPPDRLLAVLLQVCGAPSCLNQAGSGSGQQLCQSARPSSSGSTTSSPRAQRLSGTLHNTLHKNVPPVLLQVRAAASSPGHTGSSSGSSTSFRPGAQESPKGGGGASSGSLLPDPARRNLQSAAAACRRFGWIGFWSQLTLSIVSAIILLFSVAFTSQVGVEGKCLQ